MNLGCGQNKIEGAINVDIEESVKPELLWDFKKGLPFPDNFVDEIYFFHVIEHIEEKFHETLLFEFHRVLKPNGRLYIAYPEFVKVATNYINNYRGLKEFWKATIYGRQLYPSDYHVALMDSDVFRLKLEKFGFKNIEIKPEPNEDYNSMVRSVKGPKAILYEDVLKAHIFGN